jgi:hypothetical protein
MTFPRTLAVILVALAVLDMKFGNGRLTDALRDQASHFGYWLNDEVSGVVHKIAPYH